MITVFWSGGRLQTCEQICVPSNILCLRGRPRNRWQDEVREDGRIVGGEVW